MDEWMEEMERRMVKAEMTSYLLIKFVDDTNWAVEAVKIGSRWNRKTGLIEYRIETEKEDREKGRTVEEVTTEIWKEMANSINRMLRFTVDSPSNHKSGYVPILDIQARAVTDSEGRQDIN